MIMTSDSVSSLLLYWISFPPQYLTLQAANIKQHIGWRHSSVITDTTQQMLWFMHEVLQYYSTRCSAGVYAVFTLVTVTFMLLTES